MKRIGILAVTFIALLCSCAKNDLVPQDRRSTFSLLAIAPNREVNTKTAILSPNPVTGQTADTGKEVAWRAGDVIALYTSRGNDHEFTTTGSGKTATFVSNESSDQFPAEDITAGTVYYGLYPYDPLFTSAGEIFASIIPTNQYISEADDRWDPRAPIAVGTCTLSGRAGDTAEATEIQFYNAHSLIQFYLPAAASRVMFQANGAINLTGKVSVSATSPGTINVTEDGHNYVVLTAEEGISMQAQTAYYVSVVPCTTYGLVIYVSYTEPFTVGDTNYSAGNYYYMASNSNQFVLNNITNIDLTSITPNDLGDDFYFTGKLPDGTFLFFATDGTCTLVRDIGNSGTTKLEWITAPFYDENGTPITRWENSVKLKFTEIAGHNDTPPQPWTYALSVDGGTHSGKYLRYDPDYQGFVLDANQDNATGFVIYQTH